LTRRENTPQAGQAAAVSSVVASHTPANSVGGLLDRLHGQAVQIQQQRRVVVASGDGRGDRRIVVQARSPSVP
jgi:hypothetical protein